MQGRTQRQTSLGTTGAGGRDDMGLCDFRSRQIRGQFFAGSYIAPDADAVAAAGGYRQRLSTLSGIVCLPLRKQLIELAEILPGRIATDRCSRQMIKQQVAIRSAGASPRSNRCTCSPSWAPAKAVARQ